MGRPLKIAKATVLTLTNTTTSTNLVTVNSTTSLLPNTPFVIATNTGGLVAGTTYFVLVVTSSTQFTVSATDLTANPTSAQFALSTAGPVTVNMTVASTDTGFNNPDGSANTYSVVGGNTAIYGNQVRTRVALGIAGTGILYSATDTAYVTGIGTDLANTLSVGSAIQVASANINGSTDYTTIGFANTVPGLTTVAVANTQNTGNIIGTSGNAQTLLANGTVRFTASLGGLVSGEIYFVKAIANASAFTVSTTLGGAEVDLSSATGTPDAQQDVVELVANAAVAASGSSFIYATPEAGYIVRQKGKQKYLVQGSTSGLVSQCFTANVANTALLPNTMTITATYANSSTVKVQSLSDHTAELFTATSGPIATGNIVLQNADPAFSSFNAAAAPDAGNAQPYPIVTIGNA